MTGVWHTLWYSIFGWLIREHLSVIWCCCPSVPGPYSGFSHIWDIKFEVLSVYFAQDLWRTAATSDMTSSMKMLSSTSLWPREWRHTPTFFFSWLPQLRCHWLNESFCFGLFCPCSTCFTGITWPLVMTATAAFSASCAWSMQCSTKVTCWRTWTLCVTATLWLSMLVHWLFVMFFLPLSSPCFYDIILCAIEFLYILT